ncbi:unnamed protein product [Cuscuta campestris]|uniref:Reverse transcriptase domain-containing protein n=1 Tax=Cuscuta campestris TaxID=132261 RepID=A0A484KE16_9ASTE|nr:unnamed protein product [Cuscuta campestris]
MESSPCLLPLPSPIKDYHNSLHSSPFLTKFHSILLLGVRRTWWCCRIGVRSPEVRAIVAGSFAGKSSKPPLRFEKAELKALKAQEDYETNLGDTLKCLANQANAELIVASNRVTTFWKQKAHLKWMELGDQNSSFFHSYVKGRRASLKIRSVSTVGGKKLFQEEDIKNEAMEYFKNVFSSITLVDDQEILRHIPTLITTENNNSMTLIPEKEEIKKVVWELNPNAVSGPDGYNGVFFRTCWSIIKEDVVKASQEFFMGLPIPKSFGSTFITLIPKKDCKSFSDFRPISLSTFMSKINSRILTSRIQPLLSKIISKEQAGFQKGMGVEDQVLMTCEMAHSLDTKCESGNAIIKLDMVKAFDRIEWGFLKRVLGGFGFSNRVQHLLTANMEATYISILLNGSPTGFFKMKRGVKQGDPLSPLLFIIAGEVFSRMIKTSMESKFLKSYNSGRSLLVSHLAYDDDLIIFLRGGVRNLLKFKAILDQYSKGSGQEVNFSKSRFYVGSKLPANIIARMERALGMAHGKLPFQYLGVPICKEAWQTSSGAITMAPLNITGKIGTPYVAPRRKEDWV